MKRKYDEIMDRVEVSEEMRGRILQNIGQAPAEPEKKKAPSKGILKILLPIAPCLVVAVGVFTAVSLRREPVPEKIPQVQVTNGICEAASREELSQMVGFEVREITWLPFDVQTAAYASYWNEMAEIEYRGAGQTCTFRQSPGKEDVSGDYTEYEAVVNCRIGGAEVTLKGHEENNYLSAVWPLEDRSCSLTFSEGQTQETLEKIITDLVR